MPAGGGSRASSPPRGRRCRQAVCAMGVLPCSLGAWGKAAISRRVRSYGSSPGSRSQSAYVRASAQVSNSSAAGAGREAGSPVSRWRYAGGGPPRPSRTARTHGPGGAPAPAVALAARLLEDGHPTGRRTPGPAGILSPRGDTRPPGLLWHGSAATGARGATCATCGSPWPGGRAGGQARGQVRRPGGRSGARAGQARGWAGGPGRQPDVAGTSPQDVGPTGGKDAVMSEREALKRVRSVVNAVRSSSVHCSVTRAISARRDVRTSSKRAWPRSES